MWVFGFLLAGHGRKDFYQISIIMGISSARVAKYHISIVHKTKGILVLTMEFSIRHLVHFTPTVQVD